MSKQKSINRQPRNSKDNANNSLTRRSMVVGGSALAAGLATAGLMLASAITDSI